MSVTVEHVAAVTRKCDSCGKEEMRTVLGTDPEWTAVSWDSGWKNFSVNGSLSYRNTMYDACSKPCYEKLAVAEYDKL